MKIVSLELLSPITPPNLTSFKLPFSSCLLISVLTDSWSVFISFSDKAEGSYSMLWKEIISFDADLGRFLRSGYVEKEGFMISACLPRLLYSG